MGKYYRKYGELAGAVFDYLSEAFYAGQRVVRPNPFVILDVLVDSIKEFRKEKISKKQIRRVLKNLEKKEIIHLKEKDDKVYVYLKDKNNPLLLKYSTKRLLDFKKREKKWDGRWILVFFDVPEIQRNKRDYLRRFLDKLGFYRYQKSVYVFPYECKNEVNLIKKIVEGGKYIKYLVTEEIEDEDTIKTFFKI